jgi:hypothetical protein
VIGRRLRRTGSAPGYGQRCTFAWELFTARILHDADAPVSVLEGCWFQSSVRFLLEYDREEREAVRYTNASERAVAPLHPLFIHLVHREPRRYLEEQLEHRKGDDIVGRIAACTETTTPRSAPG